MGSHCNRVRMSRVSLLVVFLLSAAVSVKQQGERNPKLFFETSSLSSMEDRFLQYKGEKHPKMSLGTSNLSIVDELKLKEDVQSSMEEKSFERESKILHYWINSTSTSYFTTTISVEQWPHGMAMASSAIVSNLIL